ncbi:MAG: hypothetical protein ACI8RZ_008095 [Myxococcota bacterium]|jgi:hypothetical protein
MTALLLSFFAFAQDATEAGTDPAPLTGYVWATEPLQPVRWPGSTVTVTDIELNERIEVVLVDGDQVRIRKNLDFGWVPTASLTAEDPTAVEIPELELDLGAPGEVTLIDEEKPEPPAQ